MSNKEVILHLSLIPGVGPGVLLKLMRELFAEYLSDPVHTSWADIVSCADKLDVDCIYDYNHSDFVRKFRFSDRLAKILSDGLSDKKSLGRELDLIEKNDAEIVTIFDNAYPDHLRQIHAPPPVLYVQGNIENLSLKSIAIVGSRKATSYARHVIDDFTTAFIASGWQIVSGGAQGADTMAHQRALDVGGSTIVVLGSGLLHVYPTSNKQLFKRVIETNSLVISPFSMDTRPDRSTFPARNRVISGLSEATVVVQAAKKSGALITAQFAVDQGRSVFAVPGSIYEDLSAGCHELLKQGAMPGISAQNILDELGYEQSDVRIMPATLVKPVAQDSLPETSVHDSRQQNLFGLDSISSVVSAHPEEPDEGHERVGCHHILFHLTTPQTFDQLLEKTDLSFEDLQNQLFDLQLEGRVKQNFIGMWEKTI